MVDLQMDALGSERRLLFLLPYPPRLDATHGGGRVVAQLLVGLAERNRIALLYFRAPGELPPDERVRMACELLQEVRRPWSGESSFWRWARGARLTASLFGLKPLWVTDLASRSFAKCLRSLVETWQPDIVQIEYHVMAQYVGALASCSAPRVLDEHEPGSSAAPYLKAVRPLLNVPLHAVDRIAWRRFETAALNQVQTVVVFTERDKRALERFKLATPIVRIPPGVKIPELALDPEGCSPPNLLFVGSFVHFPNIDAAGRLVQKIFPLVQERIRDLELYLVGSQPAAQLANRPGVTVTGTVPDVTPYLNRASLFVAPLRLGGGVRIKILEALAAGKAVVTSPLAVEGLEIQNGEQLCLAESDEEFAQAILYLLSHPHQRVALARRARLWAQRNLAWDKSLAAYEQLYENLLAPLRVPAPC